MVQGSPAASGAAKIMKLLTRYRTARASLTEIAVELGMAKSSCSRILKALVDEGILSYDGATRLYSLGPYAIIIGARAEESVDYLAPVRQALHELADRTGLTSAWIQRVEFDRLMYLAKEEGTADTHVSISVGNRFPLGKVSWGMWVAAFADERERAAILARGLPRVSDTNITDPAEYLREADRIRDARILTTSGDYMPGIWAASAPVLSHRQTLVGILAVIGVAELVSAEDREKYAEIVRSKGLQIIIHETTDRTAEGLLVV
jgi:IclR family transcriptional regulator, KDG regulon repressor